MSETAIRVDNYGLELGGRRILDSVSISVRTGEYVSVVGPNGAGKTTLLKCINRIIGGGEGTIEIFSTPLAALSQRALARQVSYVPQLDGRALPFTAEEFVAMGRYPYLAAFSGIGRQDRHELDAIFFQAGIENLLERRMDTLSGGERQKVFIAAALAQGADVMLLDEPTSFLDYRHQVEVGGLMARLNREQGKTLLAVSHDLNSALARCDRVIALLEGRVAFDGTPAQMLNEKRLREIYRTDFIFIEQPGSALPMIRPGEALP
jgi:iron complex transport system ATP-binding protein